jgi:hypothetical protein
VRVFAIMAQNAPGTSFDFDAGIENVDPSGPLITDCDQHRVALVLRDYPIFLVKGNLQAIREKKKIAFNKVIAELWKMGLHKYAYEKKLKKFIENTK